MFFFFKILDEICQVKWLKINLMRMWKIVIFALATRAQRAKSSAWETAVQDSFYLP